MISTTQARNGFCTEILPMALSDQGAPAAALCSALLSISAFHHLGREAALPYKRDALQRLSHSLSTDQSRLLGRDVDTQLAACLMLSMGSVCATYVA